MHRGRRRVRRGSPKRFFGSKPALVIGGAALAALAWWLFFRKEEPVVQTPARIPAGAAEGATTALETPTRFSFINDLV